MHAGRAKKVAPGCFCSMAPTSARYKKRVEQRSIMLVGEAMKIVPGCFYSMVPMSVPS